ncbi:MAG TPA: acyl-CoA reductase [Candidatus Limnocylindrales bacterium]|nr:acyl-CoA reductase [Candidatus Limnocylindrales bacterium]
MKTTSTGEQEPGTREGHRAMRAAQGGGGASAPCATNAAALEQAIREGGRARARVLDAMTTAEIIEILAAAATAWTQPHYTPRIRLVGLLTRDLRLSRVLLERGLDSIFGVVTEDSLRRLVEREVEQPQALESATEMIGGRRGRLLGPRVVFHSLAGNVPGLSIPPIVASLLARSICVVRDSERQPWLTAAFVATLAEYSRDLAAMVVPASWRAGDMGMEKLIFELAHRVELSGSDSTMKSIVSRHPRRPIVTRGSRISVGVVPREADTDQWQEGFAADIVQYEGLGCLTPHVVFVEGAEKRASRLARLLGIQLSRYEALCPRLPRELAVETRRRAFLDACEMVSLREGGGILLRGRGDAWVVHYRPLAPAAPGPGLRTVVVASVANRTELVERLRTAQLPLAGVGLGLDPAHHAYEDLAGTFEQLGATWICPPGQMQRPPIEWAQDGHHRLADLLEWRTVEETV